ncbi:hypothetical protein TNCV_1448941 [Trichonephila clavipes]|nr:hypothetical protein TNCV_1448941 [Trichonephila clavipes]
MDISHQPLLNSRGGSTTLPPSSFLIGRPNRNLHTARRLISVLIGSNLTIALSDPLKLTGDTRSARTPDPLTTRRFEAPMYRVRRTQSKDEQRGFVQPIKTTDPLTSQTRIPTMNNDVQGHVLCPQPHLL